MDGAATRARTTDSTARIDAEAMLGLEQGDAHIIRNGSWEDQIDV